MWIIPNNYQPLSASVLDTLESKEDLSLQGLNIESSLMWRSKPSPLRTWSQRWSRVTWFQHLSGRILKPSQHTSFETQLTSSLEDILASRLAWQEERKPLTIPDTSSPTSSTMCEQLDLLSASSRMSKDTSIEDSNQSSKTWKAQVTIQRGEYSQRKKLAHLTKGNASSSWATPNTMDSLPQRSEEALKRQATTTRDGRAKPANLREQVNERSMEIYAEKKYPLLFPNGNNLWPTPVAQDDNKSPEAHMRMKANMKGGPRYKPTSLQVMVKGIEKGLWPTPTLHGNYNRKGASQNSGDGLETAVKKELWPTPTAMTGGTGVAPSHENGGHGWNIGAAVNDSLSDNPKRNWPTPRASEYKDCGPVGSKSHTHMDKKNYLCAKTKQEDKPTGCLNPTWVEWLMGVPTGWTELDSWVTELSPKQPPEHGRS